MNILISGITGQDGSYLAEKYENTPHRVYGIYRRASNPNFSRISHLKKINLIEGDVTDPGFINNIIFRLKPDFVYNLAAQSHVATSFSQPAYTTNATYLGCLNFLEAIKTFSPSTRFYQASSSEMFGSNFSEKDGEKFQDENTPFKPRSPYAIAKLAAHHLVNIYREYGIYACSGILFNHETLSYNTPVIIKLNNKIDILPIGDVARFKTGVSFDMNNKKYQEGKPNTDLKIWDKNGWVDISWVSGYPHKKDKNPRIINSRNSVYMATGSHPCIMEDNSEINTENLKIGDKVKLINYPDLNNIDAVSLEEAEFLGMLVGDGSLNNKKPRFTNKSLKLKNRFLELWLNMHPNGSGIFKNSKSGFTNKEVGQLECYGGKINDDEIYTNDISPFGHKNKKIPQKILNSSIDVMEAFLIGYNNCDGLKKNKCKYRFKNFKTNSPTLAAGLLFLVNKVTNQKYNITVEESWKHGKQQFYYSINLLSDKKNIFKKYELIKNYLSNNLSIREIHKITGISRKFISKIKNGYIPNDTHHLELCNNEIKKIINIPNYDGWFFDLETSSGTFHAGPGQGLVHNSPRRGELFVTRKITKYIGNLLQTKGSLFLGNINAVRDWGHASDYVDAMILMMHQNKCDDYVVATGVGKSVVDFLEEAFSYVKLDWRNFVKIDQSLFRPAEVDFLRGKADKIMSLGWKPNYNFQDLVREMVDHDRYSNNSRI